MTTPQPLSSLVGQGGLELEVAYCVGGVTTPPCGVPATPRRSDPSCITPARSSMRTRLSTARSPTRSLIACINPACGIASKQLAISVSTTQRRPRQDSSMGTCRASCADRLGRNPKEQSSMSASKIGSSTILTAACTTRSRTVGIDNGRCSPLPGLGMNTRRAGSGRYRRSFRSTASSSRSRSIPYSSTSANVVWSMPAAPRLRRTPSHARSNTSLRQTLSYSAWNRLVGSALAARYSACCKARTLSPPTAARVDLAVTALTSPSFASRARTKQRPFPHRRLCCPTARPVLRPPPTPSRHARPLPGSTPVIGRRFPRQPAVRFGRGGPPQFPPPPSERSAPSYAEESLAAAFQDLHRFHGLRREPPGSALP